MPELTHDVVGGLVVLVTIAVFAMMIWAGRVH
jgi:hypothetical protein